MQYRGLTLDPFQDKAITALSEGRSVLVCAPTGTGKTIIADWIVDEALSTGRKVIYTAPIKALSNQKFRDYTKLHGPELVGLVTGDLVIRREAPCLVMTTEILRNMLLNGDPLTDLIAVVLDEIHFLDDRERGTVWEEVLIYLPPDVRIVGLSATLSNVREFAAWLEHVRGAPVEVVQEHRRAVPLETHYLSVETGIVDPTHFERLHNRHRKNTRQRGRFRPQRGGRRGRHPGRRTSHIDVFRAMRDADLLPYLYFVFSRRDTEMLARGLARTLRETLIPPEDRERSERRLAEAATALGPALTPDLQELYSTGVAFHHAGVHVQLKSLVEELYEERLVHVLYCTSTFALGINMPARSVVFDGIEKFDGREVAPLTTRGFMQKAGRAGRRGMDDVGHVVLRMDFDELPALKPILARYAKGAYEPVRSTFNLSFHSIVNLLATHEPRRIRAIVDKSFLSWHHHGKAKVWDELVHKATFLETIGYLSLRLDAGSGAATSAELHAGARVLRNLQIAEVLVTELVLDGLLEDLSPARLFGVLCGLTNELPRHARPTFRVRPEDRDLSRRVERIRASDVVVTADDLAGTASTWDEDVMHLGRGWAEGVPLLDLQDVVRSDTDISGDLVTGFRRAKDLAGQLQTVYRDIPDRVGMIAALVRRVSRDEVEVVG
jgi:superfamily II RNA helicase